MLLETLTDVCNDLRTKHAESQRRLAERLQAVSQARTLLAIAADEAALAVARDDDITARLTALRQYCQGLPDTPHALLEKVGG